MYCIYTYNNTQIHFSALNEEAVRALTCTSTQLSKDQANPIKWHGNTQQRCAIESGSLCTLHSTRHTPQVLWSLVESCVRKCVAV